MGDDGTVKPNDPPDVTFAREKAKRSLPVSLLVLLGIIALYLPLPKRFVAAVPFAIAIFFTVRLLGFVRGRTGREKIWPVITLLLTGFLLMSLALQAVFYPSVRDYEQCLNGAQTSHARATCEQLRQQGPLGIDFVVR
jgi:RsiW-degrading membrane proteinase PrsW (M82 family)